MRIAFLNQPWNRFPPQNASSIAIWTLQIARRLAGRFNVRVYARRHPGQAIHEAIGGVAVYRTWPMAGWDLVSDLHKEAKRRLGITPNYFGSRFALAYVTFAALHARVWGCEVVHIHNFWQFGRLMRRINPQARIVLHMHSDFLAQGDAARIQENVKYVDRVIGCSEYITARICLRFPHLAPKCRTLHNGAQPVSDAGLPAEDRDNILFVGRISPEKGVHVLIDAFQRIARDWPRAVLKIVGPEAVTPMQFLEPPVVASLAEVYREGSYLSFLRRRIQPEFHDRILFTGGLGQTELTPHYQSARFLVNPSFSEAFGMSLVEAMMHGKPVIATEVGGMREIVVRGGTGILVGAGDAGVLARSIAELLANPELRNQMGAKGRERAVQYFSWDSIASRLSSIYETSFA